MTPRHEIIIMFLFFEGTTSSVVKSHQIKKILAVSAADASKQAH
jgi:hypothetical protein